MQKGIKRGVIVTGVIIAGVAVGALIVKTINPTLMYLLYKCGCEE